MVFWIIMTCSLVTGYQRFVKTCCLHLWSWVVCTKNQPSDYTLSQPTGPQLESSPPWKSSKEYACSYTQCSATLESHAVKLVTKVSTSGVRANLHHCLSLLLLLVVPRNKFCQVCQSPTQFLWKSSTQTQTCNLNTLFYVSLAMQFTCRVKIFIIKEFKFIIWRWPAIQK